MSEARNLPYDIAKLQLTIYHGPEHVECLIGWDETMKERILECHEKGYWLMNQVGQLLLISDIPAETANCERLFMCRRVDRTFVTQFYGFYTGILGE